MTRNDEIDILSNTFDEFLTNEFGYKKNPTTVHGINIQARRKKFDLYLRYKPNTGWPPDTFVIARIEFEETRQGHGTEVLKLILSFAEKFNIQKVAIEQANNNASSFAEKLGFSRFGNKDWIIDISKLKNRLAPPLQEHAHLSHESLHSDVC